MKVIVEIDEDTYNNFHGLYILNLARCCGKTIMDKCYKALLNGTPILDNATNLEVLMTVFPNVTLNEIMYVDINWAKKPYKKGDKHDSK